MTPYLAIDPGHATGWAAFDAAGDPTGFGTCHGKEEVYALLAEKAPELIVCEEWISKGGKSFGGDKMVTIRVIGAIELYCSMNNVKLVMQPNTVKSIAYMWAGIKVPKNHALSHETDAFVHGVYYLQKNGVRKPQQGKALK